jgi:hypothetical protein
MIMHIKRIALIFFASVCIIACKSPDHISVWTKEYENKLYKQIDDAAKSRIPDDNKRSELVVYTLKRLKQELPNGLESVPNDSLQKVSANIGAEYGFTHKYATIGVRSYVKWSPKVEQAIKDYISSTNPKDKSLCDCVITKIKKAYPDSLAVPFDRELMVKFMNECRAGTN